jgi:hypothetical protein
LGRRLLPEEKPMTLKHDLGTFEGFNFRNQAALDRNLTADEILDWDHDGAGEAEFWPAGDHPGVASVFDRKSAVAGSELEALDDLLRQLGQDDTETFLRIRYAVHDRGLDLAGLTAAEVEDAPLYLYRGTNFSDLYREAGYDLFEAYYPDLYALWEKTPCDGLHFDPVAFLESPGFTLAEVTLSGEKWLLVHPD